MAEGKLGSEVTIVGDVDVYTVPASRTTSADIILTHTGTDADITVYIRTGAKANKDIVWPLTSMTATSNARIELTGVVMSPAEVVTVTSTAVDIAVRVQGFEEVEIT